MRSTGDGPESTLRVIAIGVWAVAIDVMFVSATTAADLFMQHAADWGQGLALGLAIDAALAVALVGDKALDQLGRRSGWGTALRWVATGMSLVLNCSAAFLNRDLLGMTLHAIPPMLLIVLTEAAQSYRTALAGHRRDQAEAEEQERLAAEQARASEEQRRKARTERQQPVVVATRTRKPIEVAKPSNVRGINQGDSKRERARAYFMEQVLVEGRDPMDKKLSAAECDRAVGANGYSKSHIDDWRAEALAAIRPGTAVAGN